MFEGDRKRESEKRSLELVFSFSHSFDLCLLVVFILTFQYVTLVYFSFLDSFFTYSEAFFTNQVTTTGCKLYI